MAPHLQILLRGCVCMHACMYVCMYVCITACDGHMVVVGGNNGASFTDTAERVCVCIYVRMYVCMCAMVIWSFLAGIMARRLQCC